MRILFLGQIDPGQTSLMRLRALARLGHEVRGVNTVEPWLRATWLRRHSQKRLGFGSVVDEINRRVAVAAQEFKPELVWAEKQEYLRGETLAALRRTGARLVHFTPDPYFTLSWKRTRLMDEAIRQFDVLVFRLESEYGVPCKLEPLPFRHARWVRGDEAAIDQLVEGRSRMRLFDSKGSSILLFEDEWALRSTLERVKGKLEFLDAAP